MRIPFDIKYRPQIESGEYKVETRDGRPVRIALWDFKFENYPILAAVKSLERNNAEETDETYTIDGSFYFNKRETLSDLFIVIPDEEGQSDFEKNVIDAIQESLKCTLGRITYMDKAKDIYNAIRPFIEKELDKAYKYDDELQYKKALEDATESLHKWLQRVSY